MKWPVNDIAKLKELTASQITGKAIEELSAKGARVRRVNNVAAYRNRRHQVQSGWPDVQGYTQNGITILCEVKKIGDTLKPAQKERLEDGKRCGCVCLIATQNKVTGLFELLEFSI